MALVGARKPSCPTDDLWDPERDVHFRPARFLTGRNAERAAAEALTSIYKVLVRQERAAAKTSPALAKQRLGKIHHSLMKAAADLEGLSQAELRVIVEAANNENAPFVQLLIPDRWPDLDSRSMLSADLRNKCEQFGLLIKSMNVSRRGTVWSDNTGGRGRSILRHLGIAPASWQLIHMTWRLLEDLGHPLESSTDRQKLAELIAYIHELATGEQDTEFDPQIARYATIRPEFNALSISLRQAAERYRLENFYQLQENLERRMGSPQPPRHIQDVQRKIDRYVDLRDQLTGGPKAVIRKPSKNS